MRNPLVWLSAFVGAALLAATGVLYLGTDSTIENVRFDQGKTTSQIFFPAASQKEERIVRHPNADGGAVDDVLMRDHTTKRIVYDQKMTMRQIFAYFPGPSPEEQGPLMYEKEHAPDAHLLAEKHLRLDGSLEMDGHFGSNGLYVRHLFYPGASADPKVLTVSSERVFDKLWNHVSQIDYRSDKTMQLAHVWDKEGAELVSTYAADGLTRTLQEKFKDGIYDRSDFLSDGVTVSLETINSYAGTTYRWFRPGPSHALLLEVTFDNSLSHEITIPSQSGQPLIKQVWSPDYNIKAVDGQFTRVLDHIDHYNAAGKVDIRYGYGLFGGLSNVTVLLGGETYYGARQLYTVDADGWATKVETFDDKNTSDGGKAVTHVDGKHFVLETWMVTRPTYEVPKLKDGLKLYGEPPQMDPY
jgi:hypothetical protein